MTLLKGKVEILKAFLTTKFRSFKSRDDLERWQQKKLRRFENKVLSNSPYYSSFKDKGLAQYPIINKSGHMNNFNRINTKGLDKKALFDVAVHAEESREFSPKYHGLSVGLSSGTSGNRGLFVASDSERHQWAGTILAKMIPDLFFNSVRHPFKKQSIAFFLRANNNLYETVTSRIIAFQFYDLLNDIDYHVKQLNDQQPNIVIGPPKLLRMLAEHDKLKITPQKIVSVAEVLEEVDKTIIQDYFGSVIHQVYQCTEGFLASSCHYGHLHLNEDCVLIEKNWIDKASGRFSPVITDFNRSTQPIVRYKLDDVLIENPEVCPCGSPMTRIEKVEGRCDDILFLPNKHHQFTAVFSDYICRAITGVSTSITDFYVIQHSPQQLTIHLPISVHQSEPVTIKKALIQQLTLSLNRLFFKVNVAAPEYDFQFDYHESIATKRRRVQRLFELSDDDNFNEDVQVA